MESNKTILSRMLRSVTNKWLNKYIEKSEGSQKSLIRERSRRSKLKGKNGKV